MIRTCGVLACILALAAAGGTEPVTLIAANPLDAPRPNAICVGPASLLGQALAPGTVQGVLPGGAVIPVQIDDLDGDGVGDELVMILNLAPEQSLRVWVDAARSWSGSGDRADARTSWRYDGYAALDTDRMGFGLYGIYAPAGLPGSLQWDLYGKRPEAWRLSLDDLEGVNYHEDNPVAVDYLLVGSSMGLGGPIIGDSRPLASENDGYEYRELCDGPVRAGLEVTVAGWQAPPGGVFNAVIRYFVYAHHDFIDARFEVDQLHPGGGPFGLGVRRIPHPEVFLGAASEGILGLIGQQPDIIGQTGLAVIFDPEWFLTWDVLPEEDDAYVVRLKSDRNRYHAWLVGVWEHGGIADAETFGEHLRHLAHRFREPVGLSK